MTRLILVLAAVLLLTAGGTREQPSLSPGPARIDLQTKLVQVKRLTGASISKVYAIYNRPAYKTQIGLAVLIFTDVDHGWHACKAYIRLGRGEIIADGLVPAAAGFLTLAVLGGTGYYSNVGGTITFQPLSPTVGVLLATLEAF